VSWPEEFQLQVPGFASSFRTQRESGLRPGTIAVNAATDLLPRLLPPDVVVDDMGSEELCDDVTTVSWDWASEDDPAVTVDGGYTLLAFQQPRTESFHIWGIVYPPGSSITAPPPAPNVCGFWPSASDFVIPMWTQLEQSSFIIGYDAYRLNTRFIGQPKPRTTPYLQRATRWQTTQPLSLPRFPLPG
jgi:hypothetical protein